MRDELSSAQPSGAFQVSNTLQFPVDGLDRETVGVHSLAIDLSPLGRDRGRKVGGETSGGLGEDLEEKGG